jgi:serine/threonine-protein kinase
MEDSAHKSQDRRSESFVGRTIAGKFLVMSYVGGGAMGAVYKARQLALDKDVAVKLLHREFVGDATYIARFQREARAASKLDHPNSVRVIDFGAEPDGQLYIAMEFLDGRDLFRVLRQDWPLSPARIANVLSQALAAIAVAHDMGVVHRDLKPENVMILRVTDDEGAPKDLVKVCDFGIAKFFAGRDSGPGGGDPNRLTTHGFVVGTPEYMSPEQGKGELLDARSDIYALGVILYQLLTGRVPFDAESALGVVLKHVTEDPTPPRQINQHADERLEAICLKAMQKKREDRYQNAREMRAALRAILGGSDAALAGGGLASDEANRTHSTRPPAGPPAPTVPAGLALLSDALAQTVAALPHAMSTETPGATAALPPSGSTARPGRTIATVALLALLVGAGGVGAWGMRVRAKQRVAAPPPSEALAVPTPTTLEPLAPPSSNNVPPLEGPTPSSSRTARAQGVAASDAGKAAVAAASSAAASSSDSPSLPPIPSSSDSTSNAHPTPAPALDVKNAHVDWSVASAGGGASPASVTRALGRVGPVYTQCYRTALQRRNQRVEGQGSMRLTTDDQGNVTSVHISGLDTMPHVKSCISTASHIRIEGIYESDAWAEVELVLRAE